MARQETIDKVKTLFEGHCYAPLKEAAEKWLEVVDEKSDELFEKTDNALEEFANTANDKLEEYGDKADDAAAKLAESELIAQLKDGICKVDEMVAFLGSKEAVAKFGEEVASKFKAHADELKAAGEKWCDCPACQKAKAILEDLGEKLD